MAHSIHTNAQGQTYKHGQICYVHTLKQTCLHQSRLTKDFCILCEGLRYSVLSIHRA